MSEHDFETAGDRTPGFDCCGLRTDGAPTEWPCGSMMRRHPVLMSVALAVGGIAVLAIPVCAILGILAFLRAI